MKGLDRGEWLLVVMGAITAFVMIAVNAVVL
jgi:hypothetical protein